MEDYATTKRRLQSMFNRSFGCGLTRLQIMTDDERFTHLDQEVLGMYLTQLLDRNNPLYSVNIEKLSAVMASRASVNGVSFDHLQSALGHLVMLGIVEVKIDKIVLPGYGLVRLLDNGMIKISVSACQEEEV